MKTIMFALLALGINSTFAAPLLEEAICSGNFNGKEVKVTSHVNPQNWCESNSANDANAVIAWEVDGKTFLFTAIVANTELEAVLTSAGGGKEQVRMTYSYENQPHTLELLEDTETVEKIDLQCEFPQYNLDC